MKKYTSNVAAQVDPISDEERHAYKDVAQLETMISFLQDQLQSELDYGNNSWRQLDKSTSKQYSEIIDLLQSTMETKLYEHRMGMFTLRVKKDSKWGGIVFPIADDIDNLLCMLDADGNTKLREKLYTGKLQIDEWITLKFNDDEDSENTGWVTVRTSCGCPCDCPY